MHVYIIDDKYLIIKFILSYKGKILNLFDFITDVQG
jgi:hypothetical protein